jgi:hypothetical protein
MAEAKSFLSSKLREIVDVGAVEAIVECIGAYENLKNDKNGLLMYLQDIFNIGKQIELCKIIESYIELLNKPVVTNSVSTVKIGTNSEINKTKTTNSNVLTSNKPTIKTIGKVGPTKKIKVESKCKCMSNRHKFFASCCSCGWIMCEKDNESSICTFCGVDIVPPMSEQDITDAGADASTIKAYKQKDKLLIFDKENAKRTHVHDAQADYYESSTWLTEEEKRVIDEKEKKRRENKNKIFANRKINISFDISGRQVIEYSVGGNEDPEEEIKRQKEKDERYANVIQEDNSMVPSSLLPYNVAPSAAQALPEGKSSLTSTSTTLSRSSSGAEVRPVIVYDDNRELEHNAGRAGEVYRFMKKR